MEAALFHYYQVIGVDLSSGMLIQASRKISTLIQGNMIQLPFASSVFSGAYFMQSLHHIGANLNILPEERNYARAQAISEAIRVVKSGRIIIIQRDPLQNQAVWFWKYFPQALQKKLQIQPKVRDITEILRQLGIKDVHAIPLNDPMAKGFYKPQAPLDPKFRRAFSDFSYLSKQEVDQGIDNLRKAIQDGSVAIEIETCKRNFNQLGGTVHLIHGLKTQE